jgi:hypothetical protein
MHGIPRGENRKKREGNEMLTGGMQQHFLRPELCPPQVVWHLALLWLQEDRDWWCLYSRVSCVSAPAIGLSENGLTGRLNRTPAASAARSTLRRLREITEG